MTGLTHGIHEALVAAYSFAGFRRILESLFEGTDLHMIAPIIHD